MFSPNEIQETHRHSNSKSYPSIKPSIHIILTPTCTHEDAANIQMTRRSAFIEAENSLQRQGDSEYSQRSVRNNGITYQNYSSGLQSEFEDHKSDERPSIEQKTLELPIMLPIQDWSSDVHRNVEELLLTMKRVSQLGQPVIAAFVKGPEEEPITSKQERKGLTKLENLVVSTKNKIDEKIIQQKGPGPVNSMNDKSSQLQGVQEQLIRVDEPQSKHNTSVTEMISIKEMVQKVIEETIVIRKIGKAGNR